MTKNYYKILGVSELCSDSELKSAYRKLARKWHPDIAGNTEEVVAKFKEINEAYEVLSDKVKRAEFDTVNRYYNYSSEKSEYKNTSSSSTSKNATNPEFKNDNNKQNEQKFNGFNFNWEDFLSKYKEYSNKYEQSKRNSKKYSTNPETKSSNAKYGNSVRGNDINTDVEITIAEAVSGTTKVINMLNTQVCPKCNGRKFINGTACPHCKGKGINTDYRRFTVKIPAGVKDNSKIRLAGEGGQGINGGKNGDLYINVHIKPPIDYKIEGNNVLKTVTLTPYEAVLGDGCEHPYYPPCL